MVTCNSLSMLQKDQVPHLTELNEAHYNLISAICKLKQSLPIQVTFQHVKGHQDTSQTMVPHASLGWASKWMHVPSTRYWKTILWTASVPYPTKVGSVPSRASGSSIICQQHCEPISMEVCLLLSHWVTKQQFWEGQVTDIDWEMAVQATWVLSQVKQWWVAKLASKFLPYRTNMAWWKLQSQTKCPQCSCQHKDKDHIFKCPVESAVALWEKALRELDNWLVATKTHPQLRQEILAGLRQWHDDEMTQPLSHNESKQDNIGWGIIALPWGLSSTMVVWGTWYLLEGN